jgi:general secretion pathway protein A
MYERFFGLADAPFRLTPDPRFLFLSRKHADALAHLRLGLSESSGFVCITGDVGTGKTTVLRHFLTELAPEASVAYVINPTLSPVELLQTINLEFGLPAPSTSRKTLIDDLNRHLLAQREAGRQAVVVVDEAQALSVEVLEHLRLLSNLETSTEKLLRIVLVGQPQLRTLLAHPELAQLNQRITLRWHIGPLDRRETFAYVCHRLAVASDGQARKVFSRPALRAIHRRSGGVPRLINMLCHRGMLAAFAGERRTVGLRDVRTAYDEVATLPLPARGEATRPRWTAPALAASVAALAVGVFGATPWLRTKTLEAALESPEPQSTEAPSPAAEVDPASPDPVSVEVAAADGDALAAAQAEPTVPAAPEPPPDPTPQFQARLAALEPTHSARTAIDAVLRSWQVPPLAPEESATAADLPRIAEKRGLEYLALTGNVAMLRVLDAPAVLELQLPEVRGTRYAALVAMSDAAPVLTAGGEPPIAVSSALLAQAWYGRAHILSRDFESLGPGMLDGQSRGARVTRLQGLLKRVGAFSGTETGQYDAATSSAVLDFQRSRYVSADGIVGRLTRVALYAAAGGYPRPTLTGSAGGAS